MFFMFAFPLGKGLFLMLNTDCLHNLYMRNKQTWNLRNRPPLPAGGRKSKIAPHTEKSMFSIYRALTLPLDMP
jgi:hypothetical protein